jgi:hypothetical protein
MPHNNWEGMPRSLCAASLSLRTSLSVPPTSPSAIDQLIPAGVRTSSLDLVVDRGNNVLDAGGIFLCEVFVSQLCWRRRLQCSLIAWLRASRWTHPVTKVNLKVVLWPVLESVPGISGLIFLSRSMGGGY